MQLLNPVEAISFFEAVDTPRPVTCRVLVRTNFYNLKLEQLVWFL